MTNDVATSSNGRQPDRFVATAPRIRAAAIAVFAGFLSGFITLGIGSRLGMRIVALLASDADQGTLTDASETVGEITVGGTVFLLLLGGAAGTFGGILYAATRRRLAWAGRWQGLVFGTGALLVLASTLIVSDNPDFARFGTPIVNVAMFGSLFVLFGIVIAPVYHTLQRAVPAATDDVAGYVLFVVQLFGLLLMVPVTLIVLLVLGRAADPRAFVLVVTAVYLLLVAPSALVVRHFQPAASGAGARAVLTGMAPLVPALGVGLALDVNELIAIF